MFDLAAKAKVHMTMTIKLARETSVKSHPSFLDFHTSLSGVLIVPQETMGSVTLSVIIL